MVDGVSRLFQGEGLRDQRLELAFAEPLHQLLEVGQVVLRLALGKAAPEHADQRGALEQRQVGRQCRDAAAGSEADHQEAAVPGHRTEGFLEEAAADRVVDHVHALALGDFLEAVLEALAAVVDQHVGAGVARHFQLLRAAGSGDHGGAHGLADLHRGQADAAGGAEHQQGLARLQVGALLERVHGGAVGHAEGRSLSEVHAGRHRHHVVGRYCNLLGKGAPAGQRHDPVSGLDVADAFANRGHHARRFAARGKGEGRLELVLALDDQCVGEVDAGRMHVQHDLVLLRNGAGGFFNDQVLGRAEGFAQYGFHRGLLRFVMARSVGSAAGGSTSMGWPDRRASLPGLGRRA